MLDEENRDETGISKEGFEPTQISKQNYNSAKGNHIQKETNK